MIRKLFLICLFLTAYSSLKSQIHRYYLDHDDKIIDDPGKAEFYIKVMQDLSDSTWKMHKYTLKDTLLAIGSFKDAQLTIPHGKFTYFEVSTSFKVREYNNDSHHIEYVVKPTAYWLDMTGDYVNGQKEGEWIKYDAKGGRQSTTTWKNGKQNGQYRTYGRESQKVMFEGNYINGFREGVWLTYGASGSVISEETYKNDEVKHKVNHLVKAGPAELITDSKPPADFKSNLSKVLKKLDFGEVKGRVMLTFKTTKEGALTSQRISASEQFSDATIVEIVDAVTASPLWSPALKNGKAVEQEFPIFIEVPSLEIQIGLSSNGKKLMERLDTIRH